MNEEKCQKVLLNDSILKNLYHKNIFNLQPSYLCPDKAVLDKTYQIALIFLFERGLIPTKCPW